MTRLAFFGELARIQIELKAESFEANNDAEPVIPADRLRRPLNFNVRRQKDDYRRLSLWCNQIRN